MSAVPDSVVIGLFHLNTAALRDILAKKRAGMAKALLQHLAARLRKAADEVSKG